ncbi:hypothetical protein [Hyphomicrobium sulfonivorans]|uniref:hypothetical protein n=1 Tax=Hyphomicrobium sulfonivorans TaxID=121290 RepID=UPI001570C68D|nr:hypothetical protein [Hyphomicrobium sulfonivorans]MBI1651363.1 hypothetical protein [Hyphomicrobium sulfonivorans]NSL73314.1 hypothetical protein [Hyphomicrobium sulfonivorans]
MLQRLFEQVRPWLEAMDVSDDPRGEILSMLESRVSLLEGEVARWRGLEGSDACASTNSFGSE